MVEGRWNLHPPCGMGCLAGPQQRHGPATSSQDVPSILCGHLGLGNQDTQEQGKEQQAFSKIRKKISKLTLSVFWLGFVSTCSCIHISSFCACQGYRELLLEVCLEAKLPKKVQTTPMPKQHSIHSFRARWCKLHKKSEKEKLFLKAHAIFWMICFGQTGCIPFRERKQKTNIQKPPLQYFVWVQKCSHPLPCVPVQKKCNQQQGSYQATFCLSILGSMLVQVPFFLQHLAE